MWLYVAVIFESLGAGIKAELWQIIFLLGAATVGVFFLVNPRALQKSYANGTIAFSLPFLMVANSLWEGAFFVVGRLIGKMI